VRRGSTVRQVRWGHAISIGKTFTDLRPSLCVPRRPVNPERNAVGPIVFVGQATVIDHKRGAETLLRRRTIRFTGRQRAAKPAVAGPVQCRAVPLSLGTRHLVQREVDRLPVCSGNRHHLVGAL
jgi:hypothetical protein